MKDSVVIWSIVGVVLFTGLGAMYASWTGQYTFEGTLLVDGGMTKIFFDTPSRILTLEYVSIGYETSPIVFEVPMQEVTYNIYEGLWSVDGVPVSIIVDLNEKAISFNLPDGAKQVPLTLVKA